MEKNYDFTCDYTTAHAETWKRCLSEFIGHPCVGLEVGCHEGRSTIWFLDNILTHNASFIHCVDPWPWNPSYEARFLNNIKESGHENKVVVDKGESSRVLRRDLNSFDFAYIDGAKDAHEFLANGVLVWGLLKKGGVLIFDDYGWTFKEQKDIHRKPPKVGIDAFMQAHEGLYEVLHKGWQVILKKV